MQEAYVRMEIPSVQRQYFELRKAGGPKSLRDYVRAMKSRKDELEADNAEPTAANIFKSLGRMVSDIDEQRGRDEYVAYRDQLRAEREKIVKCGDVIAVGFSPDRRPEDKPRPVPADLIQKGYFDWEDGAIRSPNFTMVDLRFGYPDEVDDLWDAYKQETKPETVITRTWDNVEPASVVTMPKRNRPGRPTRDDTILKAFEWGLVHEKFDFSQSKSAIYETVRLIVKTQYPDEYDDGKGLGVTPMRRVLAKSIEANSLK